MKAIFALDLNFIFGDSNSNSIPWKNKEDLQFFKNKTINNIVIMGYNTAKSLYWKPLPNRINIVLSNNSTELKDGFQYYTEISEIDIDNKKDVFIIGGNKIFEKYLKYCDEIYISVIHTVSNGDIKFNINLLENFDLIDIYDKETFTLLYLKNKSPEGLQQ